MTKAEWKVIATDIEATFAAINKKHNIQLSMKKWRYNDLECTYTVQAAVTKVGNKKYNPDKELFALYAPSFGLKAKDFGKEFDYVGQHFKVVGIKPRGRRTPVICESNGKRFRFPVEIVRAA